MKLNGAAGQVWAMADGEPGVYLVVGPGQALYGPDWRALVLEPHTQRADPGCFTIIDDCWLAMGFAERIA